MEVFLLAAITSFLWMSAVTSQQPENFRTSTVAFYFGGALALGIVILVVLVGPSSPHDWAPFVGRMLSLNGRAAVISLVLGFLTGAAFAFNVRKRQAAGAAIACDAEARSNSKRWWSLPALFVLLALTIVHLIVIVLMFKRFHLMEIFGVGGIWILSIIAGWLITAALRSANQPRNTKTGSLYIFGAVSLFAAMMLFFARTTDWLDYWKTQLSYRVTGLELLDLVLGAAFGWLVHRWIQQWNTRADTSGYTWAGGALLVVPLFAAVAPQFSALVTSVTGLKTPFAELQFSPTRTEYRAAFDVERGNAAYLPLNLANIEGMINRDIKYTTALSIVKEQLPHYLTTEKVSAKRSIAAEAGALVSQFNPLFACLDLSADESVDPREIEDTLRPIASALSLLLRSLPKNQPASDGPELTPPKEQVMSAVGNARRVIATLVIDHETCPKAFEEPKWPSDVDATRQSRGPYIYYLAASFQLATRNMDKGIDILALQHCSCLLEPTMKLALSRHPSLSFLLAFMMYYGDREFDETILNMREALLSVNERAEIIKRASAGVSNPKEDFADLQKWAMQSEMRVKNWLAYLAAQAGQNEVMAERFSKENYDRLDLAPYSSVLEETDRAEFTDTYGYVLMAFGARKSPIDATAIRLSHRLLVEAKSTAYRLFLQNKRKSEAKAQKVIVESHLRQAEKLLAQIR
jgi:hypothetical protein